MPFSDVATPSTALPAEVRALVVKQLAAALVAAWLKGSTEHETADADQAASGEWKWTEETE